MQRDIAYLLDIMESAKLALDYVKGKTRVEFFDDLQCQDESSGDWRSLERLPTGFQKKHKLVSQICPGTT